MPPPPIAPLQLATEHRIEEYDAIKPDGSIVIVTHNIDTGQTWYRPTDRRASTLTVPASETAR